MMMMRSMRGGISIKLPRRLLWRLSRPKRKRKRSDFRNSGYCRGSAFFFFGAFGSFFRCLQEERCVSGCAIAQSWSSAASTSQWDIAVTWYVGSRWGPLKIMLPDSCSRGGEWMMWRPRLRTFCRLVVPVVEGNAIGGPLTVHTNAADRLLFLRSLFDRPRN
ncbi:hypothetical protein BC826DRAFT_709566 [Russula brevipes]|nr:hypothetical protein BC826DRAFT_709566 [Russula brevipes]